MRKKLAKLSQRIALLDSSYAISKLPNTIRFYEQGDKTSKLLAHRLRQISASQLIPQIDTGSGVTSDPLEMNKTFQEFY